ncbi:MAG: RNA polymerase-binding protein DksA [Deltaproteobacteria bacterium]|nr:RNA polymerase-binding protein DksA [Deltaproteobacteria bacterium]
MNERQLDYFRKKLADEINQLVSNEAAMKVSLQDYSEVHPDILDRAVYEGQRAFAFRIRERERLLGRKIKHALRKIEEGRYGICEECGEDIPIVRLKARPVTNYCLDCKTRMEAQERLVDSGRIGFLEMR